MEPELWVVSSIRTEHPKVLRHHPVQWLESFIFKLEDPFVDSSLRHDADARAGAALGEIVETVGPLPPSLLQYASQRALKDTPLF